MCSTSGKHGSRGTKHMDRSWQQTKSTREVAFFSLPCNATTSKRGDTFPSDSRCEVIRDVRTRDSDIQLTKHAAERVVNEGLKAVQTRDTAITHGGLVIVGPIVKGAWMWLEHDKGRRLIPPLRAELRHELR